MTRLALATTLLLASPAAADDPLAFWDAPRFGANAFNARQTRGWYDAAAEAGVTWVRLTFAKWPTERRDFLLGDADEYAGLVPEDLAALRRSLDDAHAAGLRVVVAPLSLPGCRYRQNNGDTFDGRLWEDFAYWRQAERYWRDLAAALRGHPALAGYNLLNEPAPERGRGVAEQTAVGETAHLAAWAARHRGTPADLFGFYKRLIKAIREVDPETPVMVDAGWFGQPAAFTHWPGPLPDARVLYAFHMYEPYAFTSPGNARRETPFRYPGRVPFGRGEVDWNAETVDAYLRPLDDWAKRHGVPSTRIVAAEFGVMRRNPGAAAYLRDVLDALDRRGVHWAFYAFREDVYDGYDYELGTARPPAGYWEAGEAGRPFAYPADRDPLFEVIRRRLRAADK